MKFKEKPKQGKIKGKPDIGRPPRQVGRMMKEKYIKEMSQQPKESDDSPWQAPDQVEHAGRWATDKLAGRAMEQGRDFAKRKITAARIEAQAVPDPIRPEESPSPPGDTCTPESPPEAPRERQAAEPSPTAPKERSQLEYTANPIKDRQMVERRAATQGQPRPGRIPQTTRNGQPRSRDSAYPLKERPPAQAVKERPIVDMPRTPDSVTPGTDGVHTPANFNARPEATPPRLRQQEALKERAMVDIHRRAAQATAPRSSAGQPPVTGTRLEAVPPKTRQQTALNERPQFHLRGRRAPVSPASPGPDGRAVRPSKAPLSPKIRRGVFKADTASVRSGVPGARALRTVQGQMQRQLFTQAAAPVKSAGTVFLRAVQAVAKAAAAVTGAVSAVIGGCVVLVALIIVIVIAAVINSPFGLFFAQESNGPGTVSVSQAVGSVNAAYNAKLELLQTGDYDSIDIQGAAPDWPDVLAVFAVKVAGADVDGMDVATLDPDRVDKLTAAFWDMTDIATRVETIDHPATDTAEAWTEKILHITITPKAADDMRTAYAFTRYQNTALDELLADRAALSTLAGSLSITSADVLAVLQALPDGLSPERRAVVEKVLSLVGKVNYFWGGKSYVIGWDSRWGTLQKVTSPGSSTSGTYRPYGLDCSGFLDWALRNAGLHSDGHWYIGRNLTAVSQADALPGDFALYPDASHVGLIVGRNAAGKLLVCHCSYGMNNVVVTEFSASGFTAVGRQPLVPG